jgi:hypothetical protein
MKTLRISDDVHQKLTALLGELTAQTSRLQTYQDAIEAMLNQSVILPPELLREVDAFIEKNKHKGYTGRVHTPSHTLLPKMGIRRIRVYRNPKGKIR